MRKTVVGLFDGASSALVEKELQDAGFTRGDVQLRRSMLGGSVHDLQRIGIPRADAERYEDAVARGRILVTVDANEADAPRAAEIMARYETGARDAPPTGTTLDEGRLESIRSQSAHATGETGARRVGEKVIPVVEETMEIGKREIERGGARVHTRLVERPIEQDVELREERVRVERVPVDRPASVTDIAAARRAGDISLRERAEQAVVGKTARVVEEVHVGKEIATRTEHIRDTVKRTEVEVDRVDGSDRAMRDHRTHFDRNYGTVADARWESYEPAYRLGHELGGDRRYAGRDWAMIERDARTRWEGTYPGTWERVKAAVRHAFVRARGGTSEVRHV
ncbi:YsnF/AvaK domain-containing protein [Sandaracinus amylolyticus]|uniref:DUF2382 domain-containing protein n=1 Tax=Sandaracinus amylolyticus TaxID=927083 RepID=A0A0F6VZS6_9BACT|nr:YsnF/AvaK domain-containing protein [Sandaracinus amylolyticus]AKF03602.1 Hypothetical protein DB32_000751 [Sandaracinus amylolyticus]